MSGSSASRQVSARRRGRPTSPWRRRQPRTSPEAARNWRRQRRGFDAALGAALAEALEGTAAARGVVLGSVNAPAAARCRLHARPTAGSPPRARDRHADRDRAAVGDAAGKFRPRDPSRRSERGWCSLAPSRKRESRASMGPDLDPVRRLFRGQAARRAAGRGRRQDILAAARRGLRRSGRRAPVLRRASERKRRLHSRACPLDMAAQGACILGCAGPALDARTRRRFSGRPIPGGSSCSPATWSTRTNCAPSPAICATRSGVTRRSSSTRRAGAWPACARRTGAPGRRRWTHVRAAGAAAERTLFLRTG